MKMGNTGHIYLRFARFKGLVNWSVSHLLGMDMGFTHKFPMVSIGSVLERSSNLVDIKDDIEYKQITLKTNGGGAVLRDIKLGKDIGTKRQYVVSSGQFIMSKIDARNGAFGVVTDELDSAIVTADFPVFDVDTEKIIPKYLFLLSSTKGFARFAQSCSRGTTNRQRIDINQFLSQHIPLPSLFEQKAFISAYKAKQEQAVLLDKQILQIEKEIKIYLFNHLGISQQKVLLNDKKSEFSFLRFARFKNINGWGYDAIQSINKKNSYKYPIKKVNDICMIGSGGTPSRSNPNYYQGVIPWVKTGEVINEEIFETEEHISKEALEESSAKMYPKGSLIIAMYGQGDTRGRTAKLGIDATTNQACAVLYNINTDVITTDYFWFYLQCRYDDIRSMASGNNQPNLNAKKIKNYDVVIPPFNVQKDIVIHVQEQKAIIKQLKQQAKELRKVALLEFEKAIFM